METTTYSSYRKAGRAYMAGFRALRDMGPPVALEIAGTRRGGPGPVDPGAVIDQAAELARVSATMVPLAREMLAAPQKDVREAVGSQLLAQAAAELQLATELLRVAAGERLLAGGPVTRSARGTALTFAIDNLERAMTSPLEAGFALEASPLRGVALDLPPGGDASQVLHDTALQVIKGIVRQVQEFGGDVAWSLVFQTEWAAVVDGASLLHKDVASALDTVKEGAGALLEKAVAAASATLLNVWDKVLALLGKDADDKARKMVRKWLEQIKQEGKIALFATLVDTLYRVDAFEKELDSWLAASEAGADQLASTTTQVSGVADAFAALVARMGTLQDVISLAKVIKLPQVLAIVAGLQVALLATLIFLGHDYIGYKPFGFVNVSRGVGEVIREALAV